MEVVYKAEGIRLRRFAALKRGFMRSFASSHALAAAILLPAALLAPDGDTKFHNAPASVQAAKNPYAGQQEAVQAGHNLYVRNCLSCHGKTGNGTGNVPSLLDGKLDSITPGEVFWFITRGDKDNGMPGWASLPAKQRWQIDTLAVIPGRRPVESKGKIKVIRTFLSRTPRLSTAAANQLTGRTRA